MKLLVSNICPTVAPQQPSPFVMPSWRAVSEGVTLISRSCYTAELIFFLGLSEVLLGHEGFHNNLHSNFLKKKQLNVALYLS
jgi:hypothetical protein